MVLPVRVFTNICMVQNNYQKQIIKVFCSFAQATHQHFLPPFKTLRSKTSPSSINIIICMSKAKALKNTMEDSIDVSYQPRFHSSLHSNIPQTPCDRKLFSSSSMRTLSQNDESQILALQKENNILRKQIKDLHNLLSTKESANKKSEIELKEEIKKLKRIIEKSFYSMKNMEKQMEVVQEQFNFGKKMNEKAQYMVESLEKENLELISSMKNLKLNHKSEINLVWQRVADLQKNLETVVELMGKDRGERKRFKKDCKDLTSSTIQRTEYFSAWMRSYQ